MNLIQIIFCTLIHIIPLVYAGSDGLLYRKHSRRVKRYEQRVEKECSEQRCVDTATEIQRSMNRHQNPCSDFYSYVCDGWRKNNPIPKASSSFSTFSKLNLKVEVVLRDMLERKDLPNENSLSKAIKFYQSCMDISTINRLELTPLKKLIRFAGGWTITQDLSMNSTEWKLYDVLLKIHRNLTSSGGPLFTVIVTDDPTNNSRHIIEIDQAGPSLPREIYFEKPSTLSAFSKYLQDVATLMSPAKDLRQQISELMLFEKELARISVRDDDKIETWFHRMTLEELEAAVPQFPWIKYLNSIFEGVTVFNKKEEIIVPSLSYLKELMEVIRKTPNKVIANYFVWNIIQDEISFLSDDFIKVRADYRSRVLGTEGIKERWKTCVTNTNDYLGDILGALYVEKSVNLEERIMIKEMIKNIRNAFKENVDSLTWMDAQTKKYVHEKADAMKDQVSFPDYTFNRSHFGERYSKLEIHCDEYFDNKVRIVQFSHRRMLEKIRNAVDKEEWPMDPQTVNAMYSFNQNEMIIPAGILQPPFFYGNVSLALAYGAIGSILGHELTHGFDNTGRKFNKNGELVDQWWSNSSLVAFRNRSECMERQYSKYKVRGQYPINGKLTLGENIADNGGFKTSFRAYKRLVKSGMVDPILPRLNFTSEQLFFIGFGQAYCSNSRAKEQYLTTLNDRHSDEKFRVIGTLSNSVEFSNAFNCPVGSRMNPSTKCHVWIDDDEVIHRK